MRRFILCFSLLIPIAFVRAETLLNWETAASRVLERSCELHISADAYAGAEALVGQSRALPNPELSLTYDRMPEEKASEANQFTVEVSQLFELGGKRRSRYKLADSEANLAAWEWEEKKIGILNALAHAFVETAGWQAKTKLAQEQLKIAKEISHTIASKAEIGKANKVQVGRSKVSLSSTLIDVRKTQKSLELAKVKMARLWHGNNVDFEAVDFPLFEITPLPALESYVALLESRPDVAQRAWEIEAAYAAWELEKANAVPDVVVTAGYSASGDISNNDFSVGVAFPLPIFDRNKGNIAAASYAINAAEREYADHLFHLRATLEALYADCINAYEEALALQEVVKTDAQDVFVETQEIHKEGKIDYLSLLDAQQTFFEVQGKYIDALIEFHNLKGDLEYLVTPHE